MKVLISGGGTGGHVFPAIAIADAIKELKPDTEFLFVGAKGKIEMEKVPKAGYDIIGLNISGFERKLSFKTFKTLAKLAGSMFKAMSIVQKFKPDVAIGVGGYASGPTLKIANLFGIRTVIQEQNSYAGVTNKILGNQAKKVFVAYDGMDRFFDKRKLVLSGNPVRQSINIDSLESSSARETFGLKGDVSTVLILGGSLGARTLNEAMLAGQELLKNPRDVQVIWQVGKLYIEEFEQKEIAKWSNIKMVDFIEDMNAAYAAADVIACRAGALTISELAIIGKPAILIPSPNVAEDHQTHNAMSLVSKKAALLVEDKKAKERMVTKILSLLNNEEAKLKLSNNLRLLAKPEAAKTIAKEIVEMIN